MRNIRVCSALIETNGKILLAKKGEDKRHHMKLEGEWHFPGGKAEKDERLEDALKREIREELNINIKIERLVDISQKQAGDITVKFFWFLCHPVDAEKIKLNKEITAISWVNRKAVPKNLREDLVSKLPDKILNYLTQ